MVKWPARMGGCHTWCTWTLWNWKWNKNTWTGRWKKQRQKLHLQWLVPKPRQMLSQTKQNRPEIGIYARRRKDHRAKVCFLKPSYSKFSAIWNSSACLLAASWSSCVGYWSMAVLHVELALEFVVFLLLICAFWNIHACVLNHAWVCSKSKLGIHSKHIEIITNAMQTKHKTHTHDMCTLLYTNMAMDSTHLVQWCSIMFPLDSHPSPPATGQPPHFVANVYLKYLAILDGRKKTSTFRSLITAQDDASGRFFISSFSLSKRHSNLNAGTISNKARTEQKLDL